MDKPTFRVARREALKGLGALAVTSTTLAAIGCGSDDPAPPTPATGGTSSPTPPAAGTGTAGASAAGTPAAGAPSVPATSSGSAGAGAGAPSTGGSSGSAGTASAAGTSAAGSGGASAAVGGAPAAAAGSGGAAGASAGATTLDMLACIATPAMTEGPFFIEEKLERANLVMGETDDAIAKAVPLRLVMGVYKVSGTTCLPMSNIQVDIWQANAIGVYSDVASGAVQSTDTRGKKFLRGYQLTDEEGMVAFETVYPGWYMSRTIHIHFKLRMPGGANASYDFTSQMFFDETTNAKVVAQGVYAMRSGTRTTLNEMDHIYNGTPVGNTRPPTNGMPPGKLIMPTMVAMGSGYEATLKIGLTM